MGLIRLLRDEVSGKQPGDYQNLIPELNKTETKAIYKMVKTGQFITFHDLLPGSLRSKDCSVRAA